MKCESAKKIFFLFLIMLLIFIDQLSKYIIRFRQPAESGFYICNTGVAFGIELSPLLFWLIWIIMLTFVIFKIFNFQFSIFNFSNLKLKISNFLLILILSGAISNIIDRLYFGCVIDFIDLKIWPIFNLADIFIVIGAIMILYRFGNSEIKKLFKN